MSLHEESTAAAMRPMMGVFNNLVMYKQDVPQNSLQSIVPDLATGWQWNEDGTELTFPLRQGVKWHDGKPFTATDVKCTWDLLQGKATEKLRVNPRKSWYNNLEEVTTNGDYEVTFRLKRPQPALLALLASGWSPVYPCHVPAARHAAAPDRHRPVQIRRVQAERAHQGDAETRITGSRAGPISTASNRRSSRTVSTRDPGLCRRQVRHVLALWRDDPAAEGHQGQAPQAICEVDRRPTSTAP